MISYTSFTFFILYFGATFLLFSITPRKFRWLALLLGSWIFYFISSKGHIVPLIVSTVIVWATGLALQKLNDTFKVKKKGVDRAARKALKKKFNSYKSAVLALGVTATLGILLYCKYANFFVETAGMIVNRQFPKIDVIQPLGISFYTLEAISYLVDVYRGKFEARKNILRVSLYLSFMLTIVEGPIARYEQLGFEFENCKTFETKSFVYGSERIVWGLFKKVVIADRAAEFVNNVFDYNDHFTGVVVLFGILFYTLQLYCEFSGIMDVMCGLGELMGINMPENFKRPFFAKSVNEFWQRWHITLGSWLRDYIFYPISLSKPFKNATKAARKKFNPYYANLIPTATALFFVWFSNGFWHGSGWKYIVYGLYYYALMMLGLFLEPLFAKLCKALHINRQSKAYGLFQMGRNFCIVNVGMLIFRADTLKQAFSMLVSVFTNPNLTALMPGHKNGLGLDLMDYGILVAGTLIIFLVGLIQENGIDIREKISHLPFIVKFIGFMAAALVIVIFGAYGDGYGVVDLIYANF